MTPRSSFHSHNVHWGDHASDDDTRVIFQKTRRDEGPPPASDASKQLVRQGFFHSDNESSGAESSSVSQAPLRRSTDSDFDGFACATRVIRNGSTADAGSTCDVDWVTSRLMQDLESQLEKAREQNLNLEKQLQDSRASEGHLEDERRRIIEMLKTTEEERNRLKSSFTFASSDLADQFQKNFAQSQKNSQLEEELQRCNEYTEHLEEMYAKLLGSMKNLQFHVTQSEANPPLPSSIDALRRLSSRVGLNYVHADMWDKASTQILSEIESVSDFFDRIRWLKGDRPVQIVDVDPRYRPQTASEYTRSHAADEYSPPLSPESIHRGRRPYNGEGSEDCDSYSAA